MSGFCMIWMFGIPSFFNSFHESIIIDYQQTNLHFCIQFGILLHFCSLVSNYFSSPSLFFKVAAVVYQILSCSPFFWEFTVPSSSFFFVVLPSLYMLIVSFLHLFILYCSWYAHCCVLYGMLYLQFAKPLLHQDRGTMLLVEIDYFDPYFP